MLSHLGRRLRERSEGYHQAGGVPSRAGRQLVLLEEQHVSPAELRQVISNRGADYSAAGDDDARLSGHLGH